MRWNCMSKARRFLHIIAEHQDCPFFTEFLTIKTLSQNISITRNTAASKIGNSVISLLWQLRCHCNPDHNKSNTTVLAIFSNLCLRRRFLCSDLGGIDPEKLYRATWSADEVIRCVWLCIYEHLKSLPDTSSQIFDWKPCQTLFLSLWPK